MLIWVHEMQNTGLPSGEFSHVITNIGFQVIPDSKAALDGKNHVFQSLSTNSPKLMMRRLNRSRPHPRTRGDPSLHNLASYSRLGSRSPVRIRLLPLRSAFLILSADDTIRRLGQRELDPARAY